MGPFTNGTRTTAKHSGLWENGVRSEMGKLPTVQDYPKLKYVVNAVAYKIILRLFFLLDCNCYCKGLLVEVHLCFWQSDRKRGTVYYTN